MLLTKTLFISILFLLISSGYSGNPDEILWKGILKDKSFKASKRVKLEVLETGDTLFVEYAKEFELNLPADTAWNICFTEMHKIGLKTLLVLNFLY